MYIIITVHLLYLKEFKKNSNFEIFKKIRKEFQEYGIKLFIKQFWDEYIYICMYLCIIKKI